MTKKKTLKLGLKKRQKKKNSKNERNQRERNRLGQTDLSKALRIQKIQILIDREQSSNDWRFREIEFDWSSSNRTGVKFDSEFWPKNSPFSISWKICSINQKHENPKFFCFWKHEIFCRDTMQNQFSRYEMYMNDSRSLQKHIFFNQLNFSSRFKFSLKKFQLKP